jgi:hypothetical protein
MVLDKRSVADEHCSDALRVCDRAGKSASDTGRRLGYVSGASLAVGALGLGLGAYLMWISGDEAPDTMGSVNFVPGGFAAAVDQRW